MTKRAIAKKLSEDTLFPASMFDVEALCNAACIRPYDVEAVDGTCGYITLRLKGSWTVYGDLKCAQRDRDGSWLRVTRFLK